MISLKISLKFKWFKSFCQTYHFRYFNPLVIGNNLFQNTYLLDFVSSSMQYIDFEIIDSTFSKQ